jgi:hypothetical protein
MTIYTVPGTGYAALIVNAGDGPTMVINRDETVQLYVGSDNSVASKNGTGDIDIIDPLSYIVYDGIDSKYAIAATPGVEIVVDAVKGATNWAPSPAQAAQQIALLGLATATNQTTQIGHESNIDSATTTNLPTLVTGIHLPINAAQESGGQLATHTALLQGTTPGALVSGAGRSIAQDMLGAHVGVTTEVAALLATGSAGGSPGGVPLLAFANQIVNQTLKTITGPDLPANGVPVNQISYEGFFECSSTVNCQAVVEMEWFIGTNPVALETYIIECGTAADTHILFAQGQCKGTSLTVTVTPAVGGSLTYAMMVYQTSRIIQDDWESLDILLVSNGLALVPNDVTNGVICNYPVAALGPGATVTVQLPFFVGLCTLSGLGASSANAYSVVMMVVAASDPGYAGSNGLIWGQTIPASSDNSYPLAMPRAQCEMQVKNLGGSGNISPTISIVANKS